MEIRKVVAIDGEFAGLIEEARAANPSGVEIALKRWRAQLNKIIRKAADGDADERFEQQRVEQTRGPTLSFAGRLLGEFSTERPGADRWQEVELWLTPAASYVAVRVGATNLPGETNFITATVLEADMSEVERRMAVMDAFEWSYPAIRLAKMLDWSLTIEVE